MQSEVPGWAFDALASLKYVLPPSHNELVERCTECSEEDFDEFMEKLADLSTGLLNGAKNWLCVSFAENEIIATVLALAARRDILSRPSLRELIGVYSAKRADYCILAKEHEVRRLYAFALDIGDEGFSEAVFTEVPLVCDEEELRTVLEDLQERYESHMNGFNKVVY